MNYMSCYMRDLHSTTCYTATGWFWFDLLVVSVDWVLNIMEVVT